jgi:hypothetical protein
VRRVTLILAARGYFMGGKISNQARQRHGNETKFEL